MSKPGKVGVARIVAAAGYSLKGFKAAWQHEAAFRQEVLLALALLPVAFWLADNSLELALLLASIFWVLLAELVNSAVEAVVDRIGVEQHELSGRAKDIGSALVFLSLVLLVVIWGIVIFY